MQPKLAVAARSWSLSLTLTLTLPLTFGLSVLPMVGTLATLQGATVTLHPSADTTLLESSPLDNMGGTESVTAGTTGSQGSRTRNRGLFKFDLTGVLPAGAKITNAVVTLQVVLVPGTAGGGSAANSTFALHRMLKSWGEGDKLGSRGFPGDPGEGTWGFRFLPDQAWAQAGGLSGADYAATASATKAVSGMGPYAFGSSSNLVADVQAWADNPASNFGWMLLTQSEATSKTARGFASREDTSTPPKLVIGYTVTVPVAPQLAQPEIRNGHLVLTFSAQAGQGYAVQSTPALVAPNWQTWTNLVAPAGASTLTVEDPDPVPSVPGARYYRVRTQ